jgi:prepilin-type N-terminal cleavage/methylation domain-containing protein
MRVRGKVQKGFTLVELLVGLAIFSTLSLGVVTVLSQIFGRLAAETRAASAAAEMANIGNLLGTELRLGAAVSPYLPGTNTALSVCSSAVSVTSTTLRFLLVHDDATATNGRRVLYVGYQYNSGTGQLLRGAVQAPSIMGCTLPAADPLAAGTAFVILDNVTQIDGDGNGSIDPVFALSTSVLTFNLGVTIPQRDGSNIRQKYSTKFLMRSL